MEVFNETSDDKIHKFCLNIPLGLYSEIKDRAVELEFNRLNEYLLCLLRTDIKYKVLVPPERYIPKDESIPFWRKNLLTKQ